MQPIKPHVSSSRSAYLSLSENPRSQEHFGFIDSLRGLEALGIACYHIHRYAPLREPAEAILSDYFEHLVRHGWMGVQVFLVIAGFPRLLSGPTRRCCWLVWRFAFEPKS